MHERSIVIETSADEAQRQLAAKAFATGCRPSQSAMIRALLLAARKLAGKLNCTISDDVKVPSEIDKRVAEIYKPVTADEQSILDIITASVTEPPRSSAPNTAVAEPRVVSTDTSARATRMADLAREKRTVDASATTTASTTTTTSAAASTTTTTTTTSAAASTTTTAAAATTTVSGATTRTIHVILTNGEADSWMPVVVENVHAAASLYVLSADIDWRVLCASVTREVFFVLNADTAVQLSAVHGARCSSRCFSRPTATRPPTSRLAPWRTCSSSPPTPTRPIQ
jgi:hypothetical protein